MKLFTHLMDANVIVQGVVGENEVKYMRDNFTKKHLGSALSRKIITESSINAIIYFSTPGSVPISALGNFFVMFKAQYCNQNRHCIKNYKIGLKKIGIYQNVIRKTM